MIVPSTLKSNAGLGSVASMENEVWKSVVGYEGKYEVSSHGRVRSLDRTWFIEIRSRNQTVENPEMVRQKRHVIGKIKKLTIGNHGYPIANLGVNDTHCVHRLVADAFLEKTDGKNHVDHINSIRHDNRFENLQWVTQKENNAKQYFQRGSERPNSKFTEKDIKYIRDEYHYADGKRGIIKKIAEGFGVSGCTISDIVSRKTWTHVR